jgi:hypothetical protein
MGTSVEPKCLTGFFVSWELILYYIVKEYIGSRYRASRALGKVIQRHTILTLLTAKPISIAVRATSKSLFTARMAFLSFWYGSWYGSWYRCRINILFLAQGEYDIISVKSILVWQILTRLVLADSVN